MTYMRGWTDGAKVGAINPAFSDHKDPEFGIIYMAAYNDGRTARQTAGVKAESLSGYTPTILRMEGTDDV